MTGRPNLVGTQQAAAAVGMSRTTFWRAVQRGQLVPIEHTPGGHPRWDLDDVQRQAALLTARRTAATSKETYVPDSNDTPSKPPVAVAITVSHLGVLVGRRNDGIPPWTFIAGKVHEGESWSDAAIREVKEETGLLVVAGRMPIGERIHPRTGRMMKYMACVPTAGTDTFVGDEEELAEVVWVPSLARLDELMGADNIFLPVREHLDRMLP